MDVLLQLEKENGDVYSHSKPNPGSFTRLSKALNVKSDGFNTAKLLPHRKALGNVNQHVQARHCPTKVQQKGQVHLKAKKTYPDIETFIPYNPLDFETFEVPEDHRLSDRCLAGVSLYMSLVDAERFEALTSEILSPMECDVINYDPFETFSPVFEDLTIDLPAACDF
ncbi:securin-like isoform X2 [Engystomops pustulosus]